jgi:hypothetical protein
MKATVNQYRFTGKAKYKQVYDYTKWTIFPKDRREGMFEILGMYEVLYNGNPPIK